MGLVRITTVHEVVPNGAVKAAILWESSPLALLLPSHFRYYWISMGVMLWSGVQTELGLQVYYIFLMEEGILLKSSYLIHQSFTINTAVLSLYGIPNSRTA